MCCLGVSICLSSLGLIAPQKQHQMSSPSSQESDPALLPRCPYKMIITDRADEKEVDCVNFNRSPRNSFLAHPKSHFEMDLPHSFDISDQFTPGGGGGHNL